MLKLSTRTRYGTRLMLDLAINSKGKPVLLKDIAQRQGISLGYLEQIIPLLKRAGMVRANRGAGGGYFLAKPLDKITLKEIVKTLEGTSSLVECVEDPTICKRVKDCVMYDIWIETNLNIIRTLDSITLEDMIKRYQNKKRLNLTYHI